MSVVTNQGEVYILNKLDNYNFNDTKKILTEIYKSYPTDTAHRSTNGTLRGWTCTTAVGRDAMDGK